MVRGGADRNRESKIVVPALYRFQIVHTQSYAANMLGTARNRATLVQEPALFVVQGSSASG